MTEQCATAELSSYDSVILELDEDYDRLDESEKQAFVKALAAIELSKRVTGVDPLLYENAAKSLREQAMSQAQAAGTTVGSALSEQDIPTVQYDQMVMMQAIDMVNQGLALDAWARHYAIEPDEQDVMELLEQMSHGHPEDLLKQIGEDPAQLQALSLAAMRYAANKHLANGALIAER